MPFVLNAVTGWHDASVGSAHQQWARDVVDAAADATTGRAYVNFLGDTDAARSSYGSETYDRLVSLKNEYDPSNVFRLNQNIEPDAPGA
jgi:FAD/FMN-containing dehydrogenase